MARQLAVVQGLVMDRIQAISRGTVVYKDRCCRVSYGVVSREPYDAVRHRGEKVVLDPLDNKKWAENQIHWLIKQVRFFLLLLLCTSDSRKGRNNFERRSCRTIPIEDPHW